MKLKSTSKVHLTLTALLIAVQISGCSIKEYEREFEDKNSSLQNQKEEETGTGKNEEEQEPKNNPADIEKDPKDKIVVTDPRKTTPAAPKLKEELVENPLFEDRSFDLLTVEGAEIFSQTINYMSLQRTDYLRDAQPLKCTVNVANVLHLTWGDSPYVSEKLGLTEKRSSYAFMDGSRAIDAVPVFIERAKAQGAKVVTFPTYDPKTKDQSALISFLSKEFGGKIPTGAVIAGCKAEDCDGAGSSAHLAIVGDKNKDGDILLYHNNWLRPNNLRGQRIPYMVSLEYLYDLESPRQWMPTPWLNLEKNEKNEIVSVKSVTPQLDDLDPLNGGYFIHVILLPRLVNDIKGKNTVPFHTQVVSKNKNTDLFAHEKDRLVCRSNFPFEDLQAFKSKDGSELNTEAKKDLSEYTPGSTFLDYNFEFAILDESESRVKIKVYENIFWGSDSDTRNTFGSIWIPKKTDEGLPTYSCWKKGFSY